MSDQDVYRRQLGARLRAEANDLKRTVDSLAAELGLEASSVGAAFDGSADLTAQRALADAMTKAYPVSWRDIWTEADDTDGGLKRCAAADSLASTRVFDRPDITGGLSPYYRYRDTAMSRLAPFRPEWIEMLRRIDEPTPDNGDVAMNNGHLLHQATFFVGAVTFHWEVDGEDHLRRCDTGDSNSIHPFYRHSFTRRGSTGEAFILAVTYGAAARACLDELGRLRPQDLEGLLGDARAEAGAYGARLAYWMAADSMSAAGLELRLVAAGMEAARAHALATAKVLPRPDELDELARSLGVAPSDLSPRALPRGQEVVLRAAEDRPRRLFPDAGSCRYKLHELARSVTQPGLRGFEIEVLPGKGPAPTLRAPLHGWLYNHGTEDLQVRYGAGRRITLEPGDSAYLRPFVPHAFEVPGERPGRLVTMRVAGRLNDQVLDELAGYAPAGLDRVFGERERWF